MPVWRKYQLTPGLERRLDIIFLNTEKTGAGECSSIVEEGLSINKILGSISIPAKKKKSNSVSRPGNAPLAQGKSSRGRKPSPHHYEPTADPP